MRNKAGRGGFGLLLYAILYLAFLYVPVLFLPLFSFNDSVFISFPLTGFTTQWYRQMLADGAMLHALGNSLEVGAIAALVSTMLAIPTAKALTAIACRAARRSSASSIVVVLHPRDRSRHLAPHPAQHSRCAALAGDDHPGTHRRLRAVCHHRPDVALRRLRQEPRGSLARSGRERLDDVLARDVPARAARHRFEPAAQLHGVVRRLHDRVLPLGRRGNAADLHLGSNAFSLQTSGRSGAGRAHPDRLHDPWS